MYESISGPEGPAVTPITRDCEVVQCLLLGRHQQSTVASGFNMSGKARSGNEQSEARKAVARSGVTLLVSNRKHNLVICLLLAVLTFALYIPAMGHPFIFNYDDDCYVINNSRVQAGLVWGTVTWA